MSYVEYEKAQKLGLKAFKNAVSKGENEYLPVLDEILEGVDIVGEMSLGIVQIPLDRIVGTSNVGRTYAFANNFMPLYGCVIDTALKMVLHRNRLLFTQIRNLTMIRCLRFGLVLRKV